MKPIGPLNRVILFVGDVELCGDFYRDVLGLTPITGTHDKGKWLELQSGPGGARLALHKAPGSGPTGGADNPHKIVFAVQDVKAAREQLVSAGAKMKDVITFDSISLCDGVDPEGHPFQISSRP